MNVTNNMMGNNNKSGGRLMGMSSGMQQKWVLLFADSIEHENDGKRHVDEIKFEKPVVMD